MEFLNKKWLTISRR